MRPVDVEHYENGQVGLEVHHFYDQYFEFEGGTTYWIKGGAGYLEFKEKDFKGLIELLRAYESDTFEERRNKYSKSLRAASAAVLLGVLALIIAIATGEFR